MVKNSQNKEHLTLRELTPLTEGIELKINNILQRGVKYKKKFNI